MALEDLGQRAFKDADDANVPVNLFLVEATDDDGNNIPGRWELRADLFMPSKGFRDGMFKAQSDSQDELRALVEEHVLPLYETAFKGIQALSRGKRDSFYYWT